MIALALAACGPGGSPLDLLGPEAPTPTRAVLGGVSEPIAERAVVFTRILCFGDSLTLGVTSRAVNGTGPVGAQDLLSPVEGYVPKLAALLLQEYGEGITLINSGLGGETTDRGVQRLAGETLIYRPDLVLLLEGVTDVNNDSPRFGAARANLREMVRVVKGRGASIILGTVPPLNPEGFRARGAENALRLNEFIRQIATEERVVLADHERAFRGNLSLQGPDGLHPNDDGYEVMAQTWLTAIREASREP
jgi:lysophospholipase L1-like esterase